jgi:hypothetical protein
MASPTSGPHEGGNVKEAQQAPYYRQMDASKPTHLPKILVRFAVSPNEVVAWRVPSACELTVRTARVWLTRAGSDYDFWLQPGEAALCLHRGERIWLSTDALVDAEVSISMANTGAVLRLLHIMSRSSMLK